MINFEDYFSYLEGDIYWKERLPTNKINKCFNTIYSGKKVGWVDNKGYRMCEIGHKSYPVSNVIWVMHHGHIPEGMVIDHIDGDTLNNRIENLRAVTREHNSWNNLAKGCSFHKRDKVWQANIRVNKKLIYLGSFSTEEEAKQAYNDAKLKYHSGYVDRLEKLLDAAN